MPLSNQLQESVTGGNDRLVTEESIADVQRRAENIAVALINNAAMSPENAVRMAYKLMKTRVHGHIVKAIANLAKKRAA